MVQVADPKATFYTRASLLAAGFPNTTSASCANRFCSSGLKATQDIANQIASGSIDVGIAIGAESMTYGHNRTDRSISEEIASACQDSRDCMQDMGRTSENVANDFGITRELQVGT